MRLPLFILTFAVHVVSWEAYVAISTGTSTFSFNDARLPVLAFALAVMSTVAAIVLGFHLRQPLRIIVVIVSIIAVALPGVIEVAALLLPDNFGSADGVVNVVLNLLALTPYLGMLLYPMIISAVVVDELRRRRLHTAPSAESTESDQRGQHRGRPSVLRIPC